VKLQRSVLPGHLARSALGAGALAVALSGCGAAEAGPSAGGRPGTAPGTDLTITMRDVDGRGAETARFTLTCDPVGGDLPTAIAACGHLAAASDPFAPVGQTVGCLDMIVGPGVVTVRGTFDRTPVRAQFTQVNSCENERYERILEILDVR